MKAEIKLGGPKKMADGIWFLEAEIVLENGLSRTIKWSRHATEMFAVAYRDSFNA